MSGWRTVAVVTGTRAEFGLLRSIMHAIDTHSALRLEALVTGTHLLPPARTVDEVTDAFDVAATIEMQRPGETGRTADADALGRGVSGFAARFATHPPDVVLVLGDRIEAFAAASAAAVAGIRVAHVHGGDRAEGIADESLRHAITKLAHVHLPATEASAERIRRLGETPGSVHVVGSPAIDGLTEIPPVGDAAFDGLGRPEIVFLMHPTGDDVVVEQERASLLLERCCASGRVLAMHPNHDAGRDGIVAAIESAPVEHRAHLPRAEFVGVLRRADVLVGNSSTGLIECAAIPRRCVDVGTRQGGRERPPHVVACPDWSPDAIETALAEARAPLPVFRHPYGDGRTGDRVAAVLAGIDSDNTPLGKRNCY
jgi:UDP-hydrolysing UDP-N-acetyl-D-glucosamine 2-epimerase